MTSPKRRQRRKAIISEQLSKLRSELSDIEDSERKERNIGRIGKCYRYHNCYSCPKEESDYWWVYKKVTGLDEYGHCVALSFQITKDREAQIKERDFDSESGWEEIDDAHFNAALSAFRSATDAMLKDILPRKRARKK